jgi:hypothetical protein
MMMMMMRMATCQPKHVGGHCIYKLISVCLCAFVSSTIVDIPLLDRLWIIRRQLLFLEILWCRRSSFNIPRSSAVRVWPHCRRAAWRSADGSGPRGGTPTLTNNRNHIKAAASLQTFVIVEGTR